jgi:hypothetical protein
MHSTLQIHYYTSMKNVNQVGFYRNLTYIEIFIYVRHSETLFTEALIGVVLMIEVT